MTRGHNIRLRVTEPRPSAAVDISRAEDFTDDISVNEADGFWGGITGFEGVCFDGDGDGDSFGCWDGEGGKGEEGD